MSNETGAMRALTLRLQDEIFAIEAGSVREILDLVSITEVPNAPAFVGGLINVRGRVVPLADLRLKFGMEKTTATIDGRVVVIEIDLGGDQTTIGLLADKVYAKPDVTENAVHQRAIHDGIDAGRLLVHFIGHGGRYIWRTGPPDLRKNHDLFTLDDVSGLHNSGRLPMVLSMTA